LPLYLSNNPCCELILEVMMICDLYSLPGQLSNAPNALS
jgi:hypothetical protein